MYSCTWLTCTACMCLRAWSTAGGRCVRSSVSVGCKRVDGRAANDVLECCRLSECFSQRIGDWGDRKGLGDTLLYFPRAASCLDIIRTELHVGLRSALSAYGAYLSICIYVSRYICFDRCVSLERANGDRGYLAGTSRNLSATSRKRSGEWGCLVRTGKWTFETGGAGAGAGARAETS